MDVSNQIDTKRLTLRLINRDDIEVFSNIMKDKSVSENLKFIIKMKYKDKPENLFHQILDSFNTSEPILTFLIVEKDTENIIGSCGLIPLANSNEALCFYILLPRYRGSGFAIEAMKKLIEHAFLKVKLSKLTTFVNPKKPKLWKVAERVGMKYMGQIQINEILSTAMYFSIEKAEFDAQQFY
jgi:RimJ/RimL family protein N-acetyltransferase